MKFVHKDKAFTVNWQYNEYGGSFARVKDDAGNLVAFGSAYCSTKDQFDKKKGRKLAFARAIRTFIPREDRLAVWEQYADEINDLTLLNVLWNAIAREESREDGSQ